MDKVSACLMNARANLACRVTLDIDNELRDTLDNMTTPNDYMVASESSFLTFSIYFFCRRSLQSNPEIWKLILAFCIVSSCEGLKRVPDICQMIFFLDFLIKKNIIEAVCRFTVTLFETLLASF